MKYINNLFVLSSFITIVFLFAACEKEDTTAPVIKLEGDNPMTIALKEVYTEPGYTATDDRDGDISNTVFIINEIDKDTTGSYTVTYKAIDKAGNETSAKRVVNVANASTLREGTYSVVDVVTGINPDTYYYNVTITSSATVNNRVTVTGFGKYNSLCTVYMTFNTTGNTITIANQPMVNPGAGNEGSVQGSGFVDTDSTTLKLNYIVTYTAGGKDTSNATYTKIN